LSEILPVVGSPNTATKRIPRTITKIGIGNLNQMAAPGR
jgi:hypothetical protein